MLRNLHRRLTFALFKSTSFCSRRHGQRFLLCTLTSVEALLDYVIVLLILSVLLSKIRLVEVVAFLLSWLLDGLRLLVLV